MKPTELSVVLNMKGDEKVVLTRREDIVRQKSFERKRRYFDIKKNYHIGIWASIQISKDLIKRILKLT